MMIIIDAIIGSVENEPTTEKEPTTNRQSDGQSKWPISV